MTPLKPELDRIANRQLLSPGILRAKLYDPSGRVVYSSEHELIGVVRATGEPPPIQAGCAGVSTSR